MNLTASIESAERHFRQILEEFFVSVYDGNSLISHGIDHHRRVWSYAKELLLLKGCHKTDYPLPDPASLLIASYMHDIGMSVDPGPGHGEMSMKLCLKFLQQYDLDKNDYRDVLETIRNHDKKDYSGGEGISPLLDVLSVADDLDAFGFTGIYRYSEIWLARKINPLKLGYLVRENSAGRFAKFKCLMGTESEYFTRHRKRYEILDNFFMHFNRQVDSYNFETDDPAGFCGLVQLFMPMISDHQSLKDFFIIAGSYCDDIIIGHYVNGLKAELLPGL